MTKSRRTALRAFGDLLAGRSVGGRLAGDPFASEIAHGAARHLLRLDWIIEQAGGREKSRIDPKTLNILRLGCYQLIFMTSVPAYAAVNESVETAKAVVPKAAGFVNWLLRRVGPDYRDRPRRDEIPESADWLATYFSFPDWVVRRWTSRYGMDGAEELLAAMNRFPDLDVRVNLLNSSREDAAADLKGEEAAVTEGRYSPAALRLRGVRNIAGLPLFAAGGLYIQDESSQLPALALAPRAGERILDACCGVGGKAGHLFEFAGGRADITAVDSDPGRLTLLRENMKRLGHGRVKPVMADILKGFADDGGGFDGILVDAPCSSLGIIRRHPEIKWAKKESDPARFAGKQLAILEKAAELCRPGGRIAYSTCTTEPEENEGVIERFLSRMEGFSAVPISTDTIAHIEDLRTPEGFLVTLPHRHNLNGGFVALLQRRP